MHQPETIDHYAEAKRVVDSILSNFKSHPAVSTHGVLTKFRWLSPASPVPDSSLLQILVGKAASHEKAVQFVE